MYGEAKGDNVGVFQGSAISALIFIIYLDDMMESLAALKRRTALPMRVIQDRPREQNKKLLCVEIKNAEADVYEAVRKTRTIRTNTTEMTKHARTGKQDLGRRNVSNSTRHTEKTI